MRILGGTNGELENHSFDVQTFGQQDRQFFLRCENGGARDMVEIDFTTGSKVSEVAVFLKGPYSRTHGPKWAAGTTARVGGQTLWTWLRKTRVDAIWHVDVLSKPRHLGDFRFQRFDIVWLCSSKNLLLRLQGCQGAHQTIPWTCVEPFCDTAKFSKCHEFDSTRQTLAQLFWSQQTLNVRFPKAFSWLDCLLQMQFLSWYIYSNNNESRCREVGDSTHAGIRLDFCSVPAAVRG